MKKIICILLSATMVCSALFAQTADKKAMPAATKKEATKPAPGKAEKPAGPMKKDGTLDKRFKANKEAKTGKPAGPVKKDGTPDMRHKVNRDAAKKDATAPAKK